MPDRGRLVVSLRVGESIRVQKPQQDAVLICDEIKARSGAWVRYTDADVDVPEAFLGVGADPLRSGELTVTCLGAKSNRVRIAVAAPKDWRITREAA